MANDEHVAMLKKDVAAWNEWRDENQSLWPDLIQANLHGADLVEANLYRANLTEANLTEANLTKAILIGANLTGAKLSGADLSRAYLLNTVFHQIALRNVKGLDCCVHLGECSFDFYTLEISGPLPITFLRGIGLPDRLIEYLPSLLNEAIQHYSCFISYSSKDQAFAERVHVDLQNNGVRCWFAPHDMPIGAKIIDAIDEAIGLRDKVLLILSESAIRSDWRRGAHTQASRSLSGAHRRGRDADFEAWARLLRGQRNIGDFTRWKEHDSYQKSFERLMRDLRVEKPGQ